MSTPDVVEVHLEELGQHSWVKALLNTASSSYGSAQFRFVARPLGEDGGLADHQVLGATFPMMPAQDLNNVNEPNAWLDTARERLQELDRQLVAEGWQRQPGVGRHWWSLSYRHAT